MWSEPRYEECALINLGHTSYNLQLESTTFRSGYLLIVCQKGNGNIVPMLRYGMLELIAANGGKGSNFDTRLFDGEKSLRSMRFQMCREEAVVRV